jgi:hypothetical protein
MSTIPVPELFVDSYRKFIEAIDSQATRIVYRHSLKALPVFLVSMLGYNAAPEPAAPLILI